jgi:hypothetical protein
MSEGAPSPEDLQRELEQVRAASPPVQGSEQQAPVWKFLLKSGLRLVSLYAALMVLFFAIWAFFSPGK